MTLRELNAQLTYPYRQRGRTHDYGDIAGAGAAGALSRARRGYHLPQEWRNRPKLEKPFEPHAYDRRNFHFAIETVVRGIELDDAPRVVSERVHFALAALADAPAEAHPVAIYK